MDIVIVGLPKSGTTGLFYKIRNSLVGSVRAHFECHAAPDLNVGQDDHVLAKVLYRSDAGFLSSFEKFAKKIAIVRDPRDRLVSSVLYSKASAGQSRNQDRCSQAPDRGAADRFCLKQIAEIQKIA